MAKSSGKWKKAANAVIFDIPVDDLPLLNPVFKRYIRILYDNDLNSTADLITAYLSCSLAEIKGLGRKFFDAIKDFLSHQHKYQSDYKKLFPASQMIETTVDIPWEVLCPIILLLILNLLYLFLPFKNPILKQTMFSVPVCIYLVKLSIVPAEQFKQEITLLRELLLIPSMIFVINVITLTNILLLPILKFVNMSKFRFM